MIEQPGLFDSEPIPPTILRSVKPAHACHICGRTYTPGLPGAGTKYCSWDCKREGYWGRAYRSRGQPDRTPCRICAEPCRSKMNICPSCQKARAWIRSLHGHKAPERFWSHMIDGPHTCMNPGCGRDLSRTTANSKGHRISEMCVDHDHACCRPEERRYSCGKCVRGLLCQHCNRALGLLGESPERIDGLKEYLLSQF